MIKKFLKYIYLKYKNNGIYSLDISTKARIDKEVSINKNTFVDDNCQLGAYTYIGKSCNITKSIIGRYCSIANNVSIGQGEHNLDRVSTSSLFYTNTYELLTKEPCIIGHDVWIGTDVVILRGVEIGNGAVVGANSVVTKDVPPFAIVVGSPARIIRYRFDEMKRKKILDTKWFNYDLQKSKRIIRRLECE